MEKKDIFVAEYNGEIVGFGENYESLNKELLEIYPENTLVYYTTKAEINPVEGEFPFIITEETTEQMEPYYGMSTEHEGKNSGNLISAT